MVVVALLAGVQLASASPRSLRSLEARVEALADQLQTLEKEAQAHTELAETFIQGDVDHDGKLSMREFSKMHSEGVFNFERRNGFTDFFTKDIVGLAKDIVDVLTPWSDTLKSIGDFVPGVSLATTLVELANRAPAGGYTTKAGVESALKNAAKDLGWALTSEALNLAAPGAGVALTKAVLLAAKKVAEENA